MSSLRAYLFLVVLGLSLLGLVMIYSATYRDHGTHYLLVRALHVVAGIAVFAAASRVRYTAWRRYAPALYVVVLVGLVLVLVPGSGLRSVARGGGSTSGPVSLQPAEFAKLAAVLALSCSVARLPRGSGLPLKPLDGRWGTLRPGPRRAGLRHSVVLLAGAAGSLWASELRTRDSVLSGSRDVRFARRG
jgi:cell division protein FtsW (lipid II flippase)